MQQTYYYNIYLIILQILFLMNIYKNNCILILTKHKIINLNHNSREWKHELPSNDE